MSKLRLLALSAMAIGVGAISSQAQAGLAISYQFGAGPITIVQDGGAGDINPDAGAIGAVVMGGGYNFFIQTAQSFPIAGTPGSPILRMSTGEGSTAADGLSNTQALTVRATQTDFTLAGNSEFDIGSGVIFPAGSDGIAPLATATYSYFLDNDNAQFGETTPLSTEMFTFTDSSVQSQSSNVIQTAITDGSFSLTTMIVLAGIDPGKTFSANAAIASVLVPEPATLALFGAGLLGLAGVRRMRRREVA